MIGGGLHPGVVYTLGRFVILMAVGGVLYLFGFRDLILLVGALLVSMPVSLVLLRGYRQAWAERIEDAAARRQEIRQRISDEDER